MYNEYFYIITYNYYCNEMFEKNLIKINFNLIEQFLQFWVFHKTRVSII